MPRIWCKNALGPSCTRFLQRCCIHNHTRYSRQYSAYVGSHDIAQHLRQMKASFPDRSSTARRRIHNRSQMARKLRRLFKHSSSTSIPHLSTSIPHLSTSILHLSDSIPHLSTSISYLCTSILHLSTSIPHLSTSIPHLSTTIPHLSTSIPHLSTSIPHLSTSIPHLLPLSHISLPLSYNSLHRS